jgi:hypothetical protein
MNPDNLIDQINKACKKSISNDFRLIIKDNFHNVRRFVIEGKSIAINRFDIPQESVNVLKWFNDMWLYLEVKFKAEQKKINKKVFIQENYSVSLSVYQGHDLDKQKYQLFRAEWDDFNHEEKHAQPHWHITSNQALESSFIKYSETFEKQDYIELLKSEKQKICEVRNLHFAMNGNWQNNLTHIHRIESEKQLVDWILGLLSHIRTELELQSIY